MIPLILPGFSRAIPYIVVAVLSLGCIFYAYSRGHNAGEAKVQAKFDKYVSVAEREYDKAVAETARVEEQRDQIRYRHEVAIKEKLAAVRRGDDLAKRLREHYAGLASESLSRLADAADRTAGASGDGTGPDETDDAVGNLIVACQRDAIRLNQWIGWYEDVQATQKP
jgi:hypothetical protein